jgi:hypothetical protein
VQNNIKKFNYQSTPLPEATAYVKLKEKMVDFFLGA